MNLFGVYQSLGISGVVGALLGWWLLSSDWKDGRNAFGMEPLHPFAGGLLGAFVVGSLVTISCHFDVITQ
jgi:membrane associated rhomboid family serine protease